MARQGPIRPPRNARFAQISRTQEARCKSQSGTERCLQRTAPYVAVNKYLPAGPA